MSQFMRARKKGDTTDALDRATQATKEADDFTAEAKHAAEFINTLASFDDDAETEDPSDFGDEVDEDREAADDTELAGLDEQPSPLQITPSDIRNGVLALEKVRSSLLNPS